MDKKKSVVVAIGGNFLSDGKSNISEQMEKATQAAKLIEIMIERDYNVVVVHGNGPQVGMTYLRQLSGAKENIPPLNLALCDAVSQAEIGTMLELAIINSINKKIKDFNVMTIISQVEVLKDDPAFKNPTKPIGPFYSEEEIDGIKKQFENWTFIEDSGRGYRRVVPSPKPVKVFSASSINNAFEKATVIIAGGGGGIPVVRNSNNTFDLVDGVIDKDRTAALIAAEIKADMFFLLTGVAHVKINFGTPDEKELTDITVAEAEKYLAEGHFPVGSMGPKIEAAVDFCKDSKGTCIITDAHNIKEAFEGKEGTRIKL
jgi:carbamate kinase